MCNVGVEGGESVKSTNTRQESTFSLSQQSTSTPSQQTKDTLNYSSHFLSSFQAVKYVILENVNLEDNRIEYKESFGSVEELEAWNAGYMARVIRRSTPELDDINTDEGIVDWWDYLTPHISWVEVGPKSLNTIRVDGLDISVFTLLESVFIDAECAMRASSLRAVGMQHLKSIVISKGSFIGYRRRHLYDSCFEVCDCPVLESIRVDFGTFQKTHLCSIQRRSVQDGLYVGNAMLKVICFGEEISDLSSKSIHSEKQFYRLDRLWITDCPCLETLQIGDWQCSDSLSMHLVNLPSLEVMICDTTSFGGGDLCARIGNTQFSMDGDSHLKIPNDNSRTLDKESATGELVINSRKRRGCNNQMFQR